MLRNVGAAHQRCDKPRSVQYVHWGAHAAVPLEAGRPLFGCGIVLEGEETCTHYGTAMTYLGAKVYCPTCKTVGVIAGKGPRLSDTMMGKEAALDGDICVCNYEPPPVMSASQNNSYQQVNPGALALSPLTNESAWPHTAPSSMSSHKYSQRIFIADSVTGEPLRNRSFIVDVEGEQRSGETDGDGTRSLRPTVRKHFESTLFSRHRSASCHRTPESRNGGLYDSALDFRANQVGQRRSRGYLHLGQ
ncbi:hypothetical protein BZM26_28430 [Paraburkholderia strydomiana]|nr:hypothetical protein BZM26_28430 [Paraburkholderia strydomiana]